MPVSFPEFDHVPLLNSPLKEVVCQVRFPLILRLTQSPPVEFHTAVGLRFPIYQTERLVLGTNDPTQHPTASPTIFRFIDDYKSRLVSLAPDFFAVSTTQYRGWDVFVEDIKYAVEKLISTYDVKYSTRIGLRYINILKTSNTESASFSEVLAMVRPELTALTNIKEIQSPFLDLTQIRTEHEDGVFSFHFGITHEEDDRRNQVFILDFDQYVEDTLELQVHDLVERLERYHTTIYNAFRWSISPDKLSTFGFTE